MHAHQMSCRQAPGSGATAWRLQMSRAPAWQHTLSGRLASGSAFLCWQRHPMADSRCAKQVALPHTLLLVVCHSEL